MSWESRVYLARKRVAKKTFAKTYEEMQKRFGAPADDDGRSGDDGFAFARSRLHVGEEGKAGMYLFVQSDEVGAGPRDAEEAGDCMTEWAGMLGGSITEEKWNERRERAEQKTRATRKVPPTGPPTPFATSRSTRAGPSAARSRSPRRWSAS